MGSGGKAAAGSVAAATIYAGGRSIDTALSWVQSLAVVGIQVLALKALLDKQKSMYDHVANQQIGFVDAALNQYILDLYNDLIPTFAAAYPDVPQAAPYTPVDTVAVVFDQMAENLQNMPKTEEYTVRVNHLHRYNFIARMALLTPGFLVNIQAAAVQIGDLLQGKMSTGDVIEILTDQAEMDAATGRIGATAKTTHRNLGISRMRAQAGGRREMAENVRMMNEVSPVSTEATVHDQMLKPENRLALAIQETQLIQQSLQNIYNTAAQKPPHLLATIQAKLSAINARLVYQANKGNMANQFVPNYAAVFGPVIQSLANSMLGKNSGDRAGSYSHPAGPEQGGGGVVSVI